MIFSKNDYSYKLERKLNSGGFGAIYQAIQRKNSTCKDKELNSLVAIKIIEIRSSDILEFVRNEISILTQIIQKKWAVKILNHFEMPFFSDRHQYALTFELLGPSLYDLKKYNQLNSLSIYSSNQLIKKCFKAVMSLHKLKILHCDIKPHNFCIGIFKQDKDKVFNWLRLVHWYEKWGGSVKELL